MPAYPTLRRRADFAAVAKTRSVSASRLLVLKARRTDGPVTRIGLATPASLGGAVERNRVRRRMRELVRARYGEMGAGWDLLVIMKPEARSATFAELGTALESALARSGLLGA
jgi:ribonuclease P protein component